MRTPLASGLAAAALGLLLGGLALRSWQLVLLALPPIIVLALGSLFPPVRPRAVAVRALSRHRADVGHPVDVHVLVCMEVPALALETGWAGFVGCEGCYAAGEAAGRINGKAPARLDRLFTNEYEGERSGDVVIVVDARRESFIGTETENPIEHGVRAALGIADHVLASKNRVGLIVQRDVLDWVPPAFGRKQLYRILDHLTHVRPGGEWPFGHVVWVLSRFFPRDCLIVLISPLRDRAALSGIIGLAARGYDVAIVSPSPLAIEWRLAEPLPEHETAYRILRLERENLIAQLRRVAQVVDWDPATPLSLTLRRMGAWPRPA